MDCEYIYRQHRYRNDICYGVTTVLKGMLNDLLMYLLIYLFQKFIYKKFYFILYIVFQKHLFFTLHCRLYDFDIFVKCKML